LECGSLAAAFALYELAPTRPYPLDTNSVRTRPRFRARLTAALYSYFNVPYLFLSLTLLAYVLSLASYTRYLYTGSKLAGRLGTVFLGVKVIEYKQKFDHHLIPGHGFDMRYRSEHPTATDDPKEIAVEKEEAEKTFAVDPDTNAHGQLYFSLYFAMTGLHALHMIVGAGLLVWLIKGSFVGRFTPQYNTPVEIVGLYWHFVDIVWIYLFPLLYLIDRHR